MTGVRGRPIVAAVLAGVLLYFAGILLHRYLLARVTGMRVAGSEGEGHYPQLILTLGLSLIIANGGLIFFGSTPENIRTPLSATAWEIGPLAADHVSIFLNKARSVAFLVSIAVALALYFFITRSRIGKQLRAAADNPEAATYMGIDVERAHRIAFGLGCAITAVAGGHADQHAERNADPRRDVELHEEQGHGVRAQPEEGRVAERHQAGVAAEDVPGDAHDGPDQHEREHQLVVLVPHDEADDEIRRREREDRRHRLAGAASHARYTFRPKRPSGRSRTIRRNTTKIAAFCSCTGSTSDESCCTSPMVNPPQNAPPMLPIPPSTTPAYMMITNSRPT